MRIPVRVRSHRGELVWLLGYQSKFSFAGIFVSDLTWSLPWIRGNNVRIKAPYSISGQNFCDELPHDNGKTTSKLKTQKPETSGQNNPRKPSTSENFWKTSGNHQTLKWDPGTLRAKEPVCKVLQGNQATQPHQLPNGQTQPINNTHTQT